MSRKSRKQRLEEAGELFERFTGHKAQIVDRIPLPAHPDVLVAIGSCDGILYTTVRDGRTESYIHRFKRSARPLFCVAPDGSTLYLLGGDYDFTERGIVDRA